MIVGDVNSAGYHRVCLYNKQHNPSKQRFFRHRLVAEHFIPNPDGLPEVNHKDCNIDHNYKSNLEWSTRKYNELHSRVMSNKEFNPFKVEYNNGEIANYNTKSELASILNVSPQSVKFWLQEKIKVIKSTILKALNIFLLVL